MNIVIFLLSFVLVLSSLFLILLVLVQLPKKEAGLGQAFGSSATDALFGPGSGNMLTKMTKWTAIVFFTLVLFIWILQGHNARARGVDPRSRYAAEKTNSIAGTESATNQLTGTNTFNSLNNNGTNGASNATLKAVPATPVPVPATSGTK